ncbi:MAG: hypothetical protein ACR2IH_11695 [Pyrinomonadaceae bacterium]
MFEQELYAKEAGNVELHEGDLFYKYEIKNWEFSKRLYQILAFSAVLNLAAVGFIFGTSFLTRRGCDTAFVGRVCQVLDMAYVGSMILGTQRDYVDEVYDKIDLGDSDVTFISRDGDNAPLSYPDGYFQIANPKQYAAMQANGDPMMNPGFNAGPIPGIPYVPTPSNSLLNTAPILPKSNPKALSGAEPDSPFTVSGADTAKIVSGRKGMRGGKIPSANSNTNSDTPADTQTTGAEPAPTPLSSEAVTSLEVNKKPLTDLADMVATKWAANQIDLNQQFTVALDGILTADGKLDPKKSKFDKSRETGDQKMIDVAKEALEALGQSGFLTYLKSLGVDKINIVLVQDDNQVSAVITSSQRSPERAKTLSSGANGYILAGKLASKDPSDELTLLNAASVSADGSNFILNFAIPKPVAQEMINRKLKEAQAKKAQQSQPNGNAAVKTNENTAKK